VKISTHIRYIQETSYLDNEPTYHLDRKQTLVIGSDN